MKRTLLVCVSLVAAASLLAIPAQAEHSYRKRSFFEVLFGIKPKPRKRVAINQEPWWDEDSDVREPRKKKNARKIARIVPGVDDPAVVKKKKLAPAVATAFIDPEIAEGFGMGNLVYAAPVLVAVNDRNIPRTSTGDATTDPIRLALADRETDIRATALIKKLVVEQYKSTDFQPLWVKDGALTARGAQVLTLLKASASEGLMQVQYLPPVLSGFDNVDDQIAGSTLAQAQLDVGLTVAAITYAQHVSGGVFDPALLSQYHDIKPETVDGKVALKVLSFSPFPAEYLKGLVPQHPAYFALKAELGRMDDTTIVVSRFPAGPRVKPGQKDPRIIALRAVLAEESLIQPVEVTDTNRSKLEFLDKPLAKVLKSYQKSRGLKETGQLDEDTVAVLGGVPPVGNRKLIAINMERLRWMPRNLGNRHVLVNQASYSVDVFESNKLIWESNVIVGKPLTQTAVFSETMKSVVFNPSWGIPPSILINEYLPKLRRDPNYLDKIGYQVVNLKGKLVKSKTIDWSTVGSDNLPGVLQPPGESNALGEVKFLFPNKHAIYMHDTPNRDLFVREKRNFSHGCVRVENPREFAQILLGWDAEDVAERIDGKESSTILLGNQVRVHLAYFTAWPSESGEIAYFGDAYERDKTLLAALNVAEKAFAPKRAQQVVENSKSTLKITID